LATTYLTLNLWVNLEKLLSDLRGASAVISPGNGYPEPGMASIQLLFTNGTRIQAEYWRLVIDGKTGISSFDHQQKYGLPAPIDAVNILHEAVQDRIVRRAFLDHKTGDLLFEFTGDNTLQVFSFTSYEDWTIQFSDGTAENSNYIRRHSP
jgi:hypothetical protein